MIQLKCNGCGAVLDVDENREFGFCSYCGSKYILKETINVNIKIDNKNDNKIKMAMQLINERNYEKAEKIFKQVLEDDITNHQAWWGRYLCESYYSKYYGYVDRYGDTSVEIKKSIISQNLKFAYNAIDNATDPQDVEYYKSYIKNDEEFLNQ